MSEFVEAGLVARLRADPAVSNLAGDRIRPMMLSQDEILPAIAYQKVSDVPDYVMGGQTGLSAARAQITAWAGEYRQVKELAEAVRLCLSGWRGMVETEAGSLSVDHVELDNQTDLYESEVGEGVPLYAVISDYMIHYRQQAPRWP